MKKKGQVSIEALMAIAILLILFIGIYAIYFTKSQELNLAQKEIKEKEDCTKIANLLTNTFILGENTIFITKTANNLTIEPQNKKIYSENSFCTLVTNQVYNDDSFLNQTFTIEKGNIRIENKERRVIVANV
jgi:hypothetical protein